MTCMRRAAGSRWFASVRGAASRGVSLLAIGLLVASAMLALPLAAASTPATAGSPPLHLPGPDPSDPKVRVELIAERAGIEPGAALWVGIRQRIAPGWHTY